MIETTTATNTELPRIRGITFKRAGLNIYASWTDAEDRHHTDVMMQRIRDHCHKGDHGLTRKDLPLFEDALKEWELTHPAELPHKSYSDQWEEVLAERNGSPVHQEPELLEPEPEALHRIDWPTGGRIPITGRTFTEDRAIELGIVRDDRGTMRVSIHEASQYIMEHIAFANIKTGDSVELHYYDRGLYRRGADIYANMATEMLLGQYATNKNVAEVLGKIKRSCPPRDTDDQDQDGWINVQNGYLNVFSRKLEPHSPRRTFTMQSPVRFDPSKKCQHFGKFLLDVAHLPTDPQALLEMMGYCLMPGYKFQYLFILLGEGANGKGTLIRVLTSILGDENVSQVTLHDLASRPFAPAQLYRKMANICGDLDSSHLKNTGLVKMLTGEDRLMGDRKNRDALNFRNQAKIIASCNRIPYTQDDTGGFTRRPRVFMFPRQFMDGERDPDLSKKLTTEDEKSAILNEMLNGLDRLVKQGHFTGRDNDRYEAERYLAMQNPAGKFLAENIVSDTDHIDGEGMFQYGFREDRQRLWSYYTEWCEEHELPTGSHTDFKKELRRVFPNAYESKWGKADNPERLTGHCWVGIRYEPAEPSD